jgi:hypothetical protein
MRQALGQDNKDGGCFSAIAGATTVLMRLYPQLDSNQRTRLRRPALYPLSYGGKCQRSVPQLLSPGKLASFADDVKADIIAEPAHEERS